MDKLGLDLNNKPSFQEGPKDPKEQRKASIEKYICYLVHATKCYDPHCKQPSCIKIKRVLIHTRECKLMLSNKWNMCKICKQFVLLCISHAKNCNEDKCPLPVCARNLSDQAVSPSDPTSPSKGSPADTTTMTSMSSEDSSIQNTDAMTNTSLSAMVMDATTETNRADLLENRYMTPKQIFGYEHPPFGPQP